MPGMNSTTENPSSFYKCPEESVTRILRRVPWPSWIPGPDLVEWVNREQGSGGGGCRMVEAHISGPDRDPLIVRVHSGDDDSHTAGSSEA